MSAILSYSVCDNSTRPITLTSGLMDAARVEIVETCDAFFVFTIPMLNRTSKDHEKVQALLLLILVHYSSLKIVSHNLLREIKCYLQYNLKCLFFFLYYLFIHLFL